MIKLLTKPDNVNFRHFWLAQLISQFGDRIHQLALVALIAERAPGSTVGLAKLMAFTILPVFFVQPFAGVIVDRLDRRTTLLICDVMRGLLVLSIPIWYIHWNSIIPIYIVVFLVFSFSRFFVPAKMSIIPDLVAEPNLLQANSLITTTGMIAFVLGAALGGLLIEWFGARNGFYIDALTYFISAAFLMSMHMKWRVILRREQLSATKRIVREVHRTFRQEIKDGFLYLIRNREIRFVIQMLFVLMAAAGAIYVVLIVFIQESFQTVTKDLGILAVCLGAGLFLGVVLYGKFGKRLGWDQTIFFCLGTGGLMLMVFALVVHYYPLLWMAMVLAMLLGMIVGPIFIATNTIVHIVSDEEMRGKVFSALEIVIHFAFLVTMLLSSYLSEFVPRVWILATVGVVISVVGLWGWIKRPELNVGPPSV